MGNVETKLTANESEKRRRITIVRKVLGETRRKRQGNVRERRTGGSGIRQRRRASVTRDSTSTRESRVAIISERRGRRVILSRVESRVRSRRARARARIRNRRRWRNVTCELTSLLDSLAVGKSRSFVRSSLVPVRSSAKHRSSARRSF